MEINKNQPEVAVAPVKSLHKALVLLDRLALGDLARRGVALTDLAREFGLPANTAHNLLKTLVACGYAARTARGLYAVGPKFGQIARVQQGSDPLTRDRILRELQRFVEAEGEGCVCVILVQGERVTVGAVESTQSVRVAQATVQDAPFFAKPTGRLLAAMADEVELQQILARHGLPGAYWDGIDNEAALRPELARLRQQGWCEVSEADSEVVSLAWPVLTPAGGTWGVVGTFAPAYRCPAARRRQLRRALQGLAASVSEHVRPGLGMAGPSLA